MNKYWIDQQNTQTILAEFFQEKKDDLSRFGRTVNQTFEAFVLASVVQWYAERGWKVESVNTIKDESGSEIIRLKFNTQGRPSNYTHFICRKNGDEIQIRHNLRIATQFHVTNELPPANMCLDVSVIKSIDLSDHSSKDFVANEFLITFGEAKHMSAFAELIANFIGLVHELMPRYLRKHKNRQNKIKKRKHLAPFLYVSGILYPTARGIKKTIENRECDIDIYDQTDALIKSGKLSLKMIPAKNQALKSSRKSYPKNLDTEV